MTEGNFVDYVKIHVASGNGGKGSAHLHREKYVAKGGPDGGDGGRGGHIILRGNKNLWTLFHLKFKRHVKAGHGEHGGKQRSTGGDGEDQYIEVPLGTVIRDTETQDILHEITEDGQELVIAEGGKEARGTGISNPPPTRRHAMHNLGFLGKNMTSRWSLKFWQM